MLRCNACFSGLSVVFFWMVFLAMVGGAEIHAQSDAALRYRTVVMEVLSARLAEDVGLEGDKVVLKAPASRTVKALGSIVQASVPYYLEGAMAEFKKFRPRVKNSIEELDGWVIPPAPRGWDEAEWTYFQVQGALEDVMLLVSLDVGVFANEALAEEARTSEQLDTDWTRIRGGSDTMDPMSLPDFGTPAGDNSTLDGLGGPEDSETLDPVLAALEDLSRRMTALEQQVGRQGGTTSVTTAGSWPERGVDGGWAPAVERQAAPLPDRLPESFTLSFPEGSAALGLSAEYGLNTLVEWMVSEPRLRVLVTGHSDATGSERTNMELSRRRAMIVRYYLLERGISAERVTAAHFGEQRPEWGAGFDRRVEVSLLMD